MKYFYLIFMAVILSTEVSNASDIPPTSRITLEIPARSELFGYTGESLTFSSSTSTANCGTITQRRWKLDSGSYVYSTSFTHTFTLPSGVYEQTYTLELRTKNSCNLYHTVTETITIRRDQRVYFIKDHLGSIRATVNETGDGIGYDDYYPFGLVMPERSSNSANPNDDYKFTGYEKDDEAGLDIYHANARSYDPILGRFMQIDPMYDHPALVGQSPYNYTLNNPLLLNDPDGQCPPTVCYIIYEYYFHYNNALETGNQHSKEKIVGALETVQTVNNAVQSTASFLLAPYSSGAGMFAEIALTPSETNIEGSTARASLADQGNALYSTNNKLFNAIGAGVVEMGAGHIDRSIANETNEGLDYVSDFIGGATGTLIPDEIVPSAQFQQSATRFVKMTIKKGVKDFANSVASSLANTSVGRFFDSLMDDN